MDKFTSTHLPRTSCTRVAHREIYRGFVLEVAHVSRTNDVLMDDEFIVFVGNDPVCDELESLEESIIVGRKIIDSSIHATTGE